MGYVRNTYGCHCFYSDSAFKRYNRASIGDTVIFNYNSGNTINCCGSQRGGFWSSLAMGLGMGFGNLFSGFFGGSGLGFGGIGMGGLFGGAGFGGYGLGGGLFGGASPVASNNTPANSSSSSSSSTSSKDDGNDKDYGKLNNIHEKVNKLIADIKDGKIADPMKAIDDLNKELDDYKKLDKALTSENDAQIRNLKQQLKDAANIKKPGIGLGNGAKPDTVDGSASANNGDGVAAVGDLGIDNKVTGLDDPAKVTTQPELVGTPSKDVVSPDKAGELSKTLGVPDADLKTLKGLGCNFINIGKLNGYDKDVWALTLPNKLTKANLDTIKSITDKTNGKLYVSCGHNAGSNDKFIAGTIGDIKDNNGKLSFTIDAQPLFKNGVARRGLKYTITHSQGSDYNFNQGQVNKNQKYTFQNVDGLGYIMDRVGEAYIKDTDIVE